MLNLEKIIKIMNSQNIECTYIGIINDWPCIMIDLKQGRLITHDSGRLESIIIHSPGVYYHYCKMIII